MHPNCIAEVMAALGRALKPGEADAIEQRIVSNMRMLGKTEPKWAQMTGAERLKAASDLAAMQDIHAAGKAAQRQLSNLVAQTREAAQLNSHSAQMKGKRPAHKALFERLRQIDVHVRGVNAENMSGLVDALHATEPRFLGLLANPKAVRDFAIEVYASKTGKDSGNPIAKKGAKAYMDQMEKIRTRMNSLGADIGQLDAYLPRGYDVGMVARTDPAQFAADAMRGADRSAYLKADGTPMNDAELNDFLMAAHTSIATEGRNTMIPGETRKGSRAGRFDDAHRAIHFKDADSELAFMAKYGRGTLFESIQGHVHQMSKNIGLMEEWGANPNSTYRLLKDTAERMDNKAGAREMGATLDMVYDTLNGNASQPVDSTLARLGQNVRNYVSAVSLQSVMISSITDAPLHLLAAKYNGMPLGETMATTLKSFGGDTAKNATRLGLAVESITGEMSQWHGDNLAQNWSSKVANTTMKVGLVDGWTHGMRRGFGLMLSGTLNDLRAKPWAQLKDFDRKRMEAAGITENDWKVWQLAKAEPVGADQLLTKNGIRDITDAQLKAAGLPEGDAIRNRAVAKLLGFIDQEAQTAVMSPDLMTRAAMNQGFKKGTWGGEIGASLLLFKSFPMAIMMKHLRRIESIDSAAGKTAYSVAMMTGLTLFGALALQLGDMAFGKNPRPMNTGKFWLAAAMKGGGLGVFGDILYTGMGGDNAGGQPNWTNLAGPVISKALQLGNLTLGNIGQAMAGKKTNFGAEALQFGAANTPFIRLWYAKAAIDHLALQDWQETLSPGYLARQRRATQKNWDQSYFLEPGASLSEMQTPDFGAAVGQ